MAIDILMSREKKLTLLPSVEYTQLPRKSTHYWSVMPYIAFETLQLRLTMHKNR